MNSFDEAYAGYLSALKKLDQTNEIAEKNLLFKQLTQQLSDLEKRLNSFQPAAVEDEEDLFAWDLSAHRSAACSASAKNP